MFPNKVAYDVAIKTPKNTYFCSFTSFLTFSSIASIRKPDSLRYLILFMISFTYSFENTNVLVPDQSIFFSIIASVAEAAFVNPNGSNT